eukprot:298438_1
MEYVLFVIWTIFHTINASHMQMNTTSTLTTTTPTTTDFFTTLAVHQCFIGSKCSKTKHCCPSDIDEEANGVSCAGSIHKPNHNHPHGHHHGPRGRGPRRLRRGGHHHGHQGHGTKQKHNGICCINDGYIGCTCDNDCCDDTKCYDGVCQSENDASTLSICSIGSSCTKTTDCCFGTANERALGVTCDTCTNKRNRQGKACCIMIGYDGCTENTDCCAEKAECIVGSCVSTKHKSGFAALAWETKDDIDSMERVDWSEHGIPFATALLLIAMMICVVMLCATCCLYLYVNKKIKNERDQLSTLPSIADWRSIRTEIPLRPIVEATTEDEESSGDEHQTNNIPFHCFCGDPKRYID